MDVNKNVLLIGCSVFVCGNIGGPVGAVVGLFCGLAAALFFVQYPSPKSRPRLSPDAERNARGKFMPSSDTAADDARVQPDKRGLKPGDR